MPRLARRGDGEGLVRALDYEDVITYRDGHVVDLGADVRADAAKALAIVDAPTAYEGLRHALEDPEENVRMAAIRALSARKSTDSVGLLLSVVTTWTDPELAHLRGQALDALVELNPPDLFQRVVAELLDRAEPPEESDVPVLRRVQDAVGPSELHATVADLVSRMRAGLAPRKVRTLLVWLAPASIDPVIEALDHDYARPHAALTLGEIRDAKAVEPLCSVLLRSDDPAARRAAAWALGEIKHPAAVESLLLATSDADYGVRLHASAGFDRLGNAALAIAMSSLLRPALENGAGELTEGHPEDENGAPPEDDGEPAGEQPTRRFTRETPPATATTEPLYSTRAAPILRRLLGREPS